MKSVNNFLSFTSTGLYCQAGDFYIDPKRPVHKALVSHAHSDHATPNSGNIYATGPTKQFMKRRFRNSIRSRFHEVAYRETFYLDEVAVTFFPAGHMLGSAMIRMEYQNESYLYTGDFKLQPDDSCETIEIVESDFLVTETTFAHPQYIHPDPENEIRKLNEVQTQNILLGSYSVGKAQRVTQLLSKHCSEKKIFVHREMVKFHEVYEESGVHLGNWEPYTKQGFKKETGSIYILPPNWLHRHSAQHEYFKVFATGWKQSYIKCDSILHISDHADWNDLLKMIELIKPKTVFTLHGDGVHLKQFLEGKINVQLLNE
ncbi:MAG: MBL fold metallo-hydrolase [Bacteroidetes bacterium]|nr:MBL fold metallo-hydrolase [Bacteroidota bacterium]